MLEQTYDNAASLLPAAETRAHRMPASEPRTIPVWPAPLQGHAIEMPMPGRYQLAVTDQSGMGDRLEFPVEPENPF